MSKQIKQFVLDQKADLTASFKEILLDNERVTMLGIQASPGTLFKINQGGAMQMGFFGTYELDLSRIGGLINSIQIAQAPSYPANSKVIIDILYEAGGGL